MNNKQALHSKQFIKMVRSSDDDVIVCDFVCRRHTLSACIASYIGCVVRCSSEKGCVSGRTGHVLCWQWNRLIIKGCGLDSFWCHLYEDCVRFVCGCVVWELKGCWCRVDKYVMWRTSSKHWIRPIVVWCDLWRRFVREDLLTQDKNKNSLDKWWQILLDL